MKKRLRVKYAYVPRGGDEDTVSFAGVTLDSGEHVNFVPAFSVNLGEAADFPRPWFPISERRNISKEDIDFLQEQAFRKLLEINPHMEDASITIKEKNE